MRYWQNDDEHGHAVCVRRLDDVLAERLRARAFVIVRKHDGVETLAELLRDVVLQARDVDDIRRRRLLEVEAQHLLVAADDAQLRRRRAVRMDEPAEVDAPRREFLLEALAVVVLADIARNRRAAAEPREVVRDVRRAAERLLLRRDVRDGHRRLGRDAVDLAVVVLVEHDVADDEDVALRRALRDERTEFLFVHKILRYMQFPTLYRISHRYSRFRVELRTSSLTGSEAS